MPLHILLRGAKPLRQRLALSWARALPGPLLWIGLSHPPVLRSGDRFLVRPPGAPAFLQEALLGHADRAGTVVLGDLDDLMPHWRWFPAALDTLLTAPVLGLSSPGLRAPRGLDLVADLDDDDVLVVSEARHPSLRGLVIREPGPGLLDGLTDACHPPGGLGAAA